MGGAGGAGAGRGQGEALWPAGLNMLGAGQLFVFVTRKKKGRDKIKRECSQFRNVGMQSTTKTGQSWAKLENREYSSSK